MKESESPAAQRAASPRVNGFQQVEASIDLCPANHVSIRVAILILLVSAFANDLYAQQTKPNAVSSQQGAKVLIDKKSPSTTRSDSSLIKRIVLFPVRAGKSVAGIFDTRDNNNGSAEAESPPKLVMFTWRKGSDQLGTMLVPSGYSEETSTYAESVRTTLKYHDGSYIVLQLGGMITSPFFTEPEHRVLQSRRSRNLFVRTGTVRNTALLWREETPTGVWPATNRGFANVPKDRFSLFSEALESFKRGNLTASTKTDSSKSQANASPERPSSEITFCKFELPDNVKRAHASFYLSYMFEIDKDGRPAGVRKLSDEYVGEEKVSACVAEWRFRGIEAGTKMALFLRWEHGIGWVELSVAGGGFSHVIRTQENSAANTPLR